MKMSELKKRINCREMVQDITDAIREAKGTPDADDIINIALSRYTEFERVVILEEYGIFDAIETVWEAEMWMYGAVKTTLWKPEELLKTLYKLVELDITTGIENLGGVGYGI